MSLVPSSDQPLETAEAGAASTPRILEQDVPLSQSAIWKLQQEFYARRGLRAWTEDRVPAYITNNPFIAEIYAEIVFAFLRDCIAFGREKTQPVSPGHPLRIIELGAGPGKFCFLFLRRLTALLREDGIDPRSVRYAMTDGAETLLAEWRANRCFDEFVAAGLLQFELFRAGEEIRSPFHADPIYESSKSAPGPLVAIANYVFDSLPHDAFAVQQGRISEALLTISTPSSHAASSAAAGGGQQNAAENSLSDLKFSFANIACPPERYQDASWNRILEVYRERLPAATVLFPCGALKVIQDLARFSDGRMLLLAADKGYAHEDALPFSPPAPKLEFHAANCFSGMVNFDAIAKYFAGAGGEALLPDKHVAMLNVCGFLSAPADRFPGTHSAYRKTQEAFGPDDLFTLFSWLNAHMEEMNVAQILAALRLTRWDTTAFVRLFPVLARQLPAVAGERLDLREAVMRTWANHFPVSRADNALAFDCGVILLGLHFYEEAAAMFRASQKLFGASAPASYNLGLCAQGLGQVEDALAAMDEATSLDPNFQPAREARLKLEQLKSSAP